MEEAHVSLILSNTKFKTTTARSPRLHSLTDSSHRLKIHTCVINIHTYEVYGKTGELVSPVLSDGRWRLIGIRTLPESDSRVYYQAILVTHFAVKLGVVGFAGTDERFEILEPDVILHIFSITSVSDIQLQTQTELPSRYSDK